MFTIERGVVIKWEDAVQSLFNVIVCLAYGVCSLISPNHTPIESNINMRSDKEK